MPTSIDAFLKAVKEELEQAQTIPPFNSMHEAYAVTLEELEEVWEHVKAHPMRRDPEVIQKELVQLGAMVVRFAVDCGAQEFTK